jgi:4-hydroxythreonine-4-phosphate dehydrogenase
MPDTDIPVIAMTYGEPSGIGPDLCIELAGRSFPARLVILGDRDVLEARAALLDRTRRFADYSPQAAHLPGVLEVLHAPAGAPVHAGRLDVRNASHVMALLSRALSGCQSGEFAAMVTAPVHKAVINDAGIAFTGHTEFLAEQTGTANVVMMLVGGGLRVALATTHLPLSQVPQAITRESLDKTLRILDHDLRERFGIPQPRILVAGLNPHAGESGHLGREEIDVIAPVVSALRQYGMHLEGPLPADTLFTRKYLQRGDAVLAMYHDQGLSVLKYASFGEGVNITLGLPIIRTSVDHGTALDLAGKGNIDSGSMKSAIELAIVLAGKQAARAKA